MVARMANKKQDEKNSKIEIKLGEFYTIVRKNTGFHKTEVLGNYFTIFIYTQALFFILSF